MNPKAAHGRRSVSPAGVRPRDDDFQRRVGGQLARRGFDWETIRAAVRRVWSELGKDQA
jgi:SOS response regulatory protein OraA/RecX